MSNELKHYGVKGMKWGVRRSKQARPPSKRKIKKQSVKRSKQGGSGDNPQHSKDILAEVDELRGKGLSEKEIVKELGLESTTQLRNEITWANQARKQLLSDQIAKAYEEGKSKTQIANELNISEGSVRNYLSNKEKAKESQLDNAVKLLEYGVEQNEYLDIGVGVERQMGISRSKLKAAVSKLKEEGYVEHEIYVKRLTDPTKYTTVKVLTKEPDLEVVKQNSEKIRPVEGWVDTSGKTQLGLGPIKNLSWDQVAIKYGDEGGALKDGVIEIRRGVDHLDLGDSGYAQVRIAVAGTHYLKGMAMYSDNLPPGKNVIFNTNKKSGLPKEEVLKPLKDSDANPFGATIARQKGALNIVNEEGDWAAWSKTLSSQVLSKQPNKLVKERLDATYSALKKDFDELNSLTNPTVKKHLMEAYGEGLTVKTQHLKAQALPKTKNHVILPFPDMNATEVYAPNYNDGERVVLIRHPHGGIFEIPELTVNSKVASAKKALGNATDAIGIHPSVAQKLSGADFDGDTVLVIPNNHKKIKTARSLKELKNFDPMEYKVDHETISAKHKQIEMGIVSNLITDMTIKNASPGEIARAVKHSMVVIDAEKHNLDYKQSAIDNSISALQKKYQTHISPLDGKQHQGASTLISISKRKPMVGGEPTEVVDPKTGKTKTKLVGGKKVPILELVGNDARKLSSGTAVENSYATYINKVVKLKSNVDSIVAKIPPIKTNPEAKKKYATEVKSLDEKLNKALLNAPKERQAQLLATRVYYENVSKDMSPDQKKKLKAQAIASARVKTQANKRDVEVHITDREWEAIQSGAVSNTKLKQILNNTDLDHVKKLATPRTTVKLSTAKETRAKALLKNGYTYAQVAGAVGVSVDQLRASMAVEE